MRVWVISKPVAILVAAQMMMFATTLTMWGAERGKRVEVTPPKSSVGVTNINERLKLEEYFPDRSFESLRPQTAPDFGIPPPPRPVLPTRRQMEEKQKKENWGAVTDPHEAFGNNKEKGSLISKDEDAVAISGTSEGSIERFMKKSDTEQSDEAESFEATLRRLREGDSESLDLEMNLLNGEVDDKATDSYRPVQSGRSVLPKPANSSQQFRPSSRSLFDGYASRSMQQESLRGRPITFREFLDGRSSTSPELPKIPTTSSLQPENPLSPAMDFRSRPVDQILAPSTAFNPVGASASPFSSVANSPGLNSGFRNSGGGFSLPSATSIQPFGPLPKRNF